MKLYLTNCHPIYNIWVIIGYYTNDQNKELIKNYNFSVIVIQIIIIKTYLTLFAKTISKQNME